MSTLLFNILLKVLARAVRKLNVDDIRDHKNFIRKLLETRNNFSNMAVCKSNLHKLKVFLHTNKNIEKEIMDTLPFTIASTISRNKPNQRCEGVLW